MATPQQGVVRLPGAVNRIRMKKLEWDSNLESADGLGSRRISRRGADNWECIRLNSRIENGSVVGGEEKLGQVDEARRGIWRAVR